MLSKDAASNIKTQVSKISVMRVFSLKTWQIGKDKMSQKTQKAQKEKF